MRYSKQVGRHAARRSRARPPERYLDLAAAAHEPQGMGWKGEGTMTAPSLGKVREEAARLRREIPEITRSTKSIRELEADAEHLRDEMIGRAAHVLRSSDDVIEKINGLPDEVTADRGALLGEAREVRRQAFELMRELNPDQAWFWTEKWQAGEREADRQIAAGETIRFESDDALEAAFAEIDAELERRANV
jgi:hypothetical protein